MTDLYRVREGAMDPSTSFAFQNGQQKVTMPQRQSLDQRGQKTSEEEYSSSSEFETHSQSAGSSGKTPSEYSLPTPEEENSPPEIDQFYFGMDIESATLSGAELHAKRLSEDGKIHTPFSLIRPEMLASLTTRHDFNYDRFSTMIDASKLAHFADDAAEEGDESDFELDEDDYQDSPVEIATPIMIAMPKTRATVVSITSPRSPTFSKFSGLARSNTSASTRSSLRNSVSSASSIERHNTISESKSTTQAWSPTYPQRISSISSSPKSARPSHSRVSSLKSMAYHQVTESSSPDSTPAAPSKQFGAFIASPPVTRSASIYSAETENSTKPQMPSLSIPARSTSRKHSSRNKDPLSAPPLTPRNPRRKLASYSAFPSSTTA